jgi:hypothetical protein
VTKVASKGKRGRASYVSTVDEKCRACSTVIPAGERFLQGLTKEPYHRQCKRLNIKPAVQERRVITNPIKLSPPICAGCEEEIGSDQRITRVSGTPWHHECYLFERRLR